jgi:Holliday junction resolvase RusA-like endonuclease
MARDIFWDQRDPIERGIIDIVATCLPPKTTAQMKRFNRSSGRFFKSQAMEIAEAAFAEILMPHRPDRPIAGPVEVSVEVTWPWRKSETKKIRSLGRIPMTAKPDLDNWVKALIDEMVTWRLIDNDQSVWSLSCRKYYGDDPGIRIRIVGGA